MILCSLVTQQDAQDGYRWRCWQCQRRDSIGINSFFKIALGKLMWFVFSWATDWSNFIRDACATGVRRNPVQLSGFDNNGNQCQMFSFTPLLDSECHLYLQIKYKDNIRHTCSASAAVVIVEFSYLHSYFQDGWTPMHWAAKSNMLEVTHMLIKHGAKLSAQDKVRTYTCLIKNLYCIKTCVNNV